MKYITENDRIYVDGSDGDRKNTEDGDHADEGGFILEATDKYSGFGNEPGKTREP